jgi:hypothetical protein
MIAGALMIAGAAQLSSCAVPHPIPPVMVPPVAVSPAPPPPVKPPANWRDLPVTPGEWSWQLEGNRSVARFGMSTAAPLVMLSCDRAAGQILLARAETGSEIPGIHIPMAISTTTGTRPLTSEPAVSQPGWVTVAIRVHDPILDAMAFSRGRFALDIAGLPMLALPSWPEVSRVIEDCR